MDTCAAEVGLLKKHPCGNAAVAKCANCEMALCTKHAVAQLNTMKQRTGKFMCEECNKAQKAADKGMAAAPQHAAPKPAAPAAKPAAPPPPKPAAPAVKPPAPAPAAKAPAVAPTQPAGKQEFKLEETGPSDVIALGVRCRTATGDIRIVRAAVTEPASARDVAASEPTPDATPDADGDMIPDAVEMVDRWR